MTNLDTLRDWARELAAMITEFEKAVGLLGEAKESLRHDGVIGRVQTAERIAAFLTANKQESA